MSDGQSSSGGGMMADAHRDGDACRETSPSFLRTVLGEWTEAFSEYRVLLAQAVQVLKRVLLLLFLVSVVFTVFYILSIAVYL